MTTPPPRPPRRLTQRLSAAFVRTAEPGFYCDGHGLNLRVDPSGARQWVQRLVIRGRPRMLGLGGYPLVSLAEARNVAFANRQRARAGGDPLAEKRHGQGVPTVEEAAAAVLEQQRPGWRNAKHARDWPRSLRAYAFPRYRGAACVRGDDGRRIGNPHPDLARQARDCTAGAAADRGRDEVGGRDGPPAGQPGGRRPRPGPRAAAGRRPTHAGAALRRGGGRPRDGASLPCLGPHQAGVRVPSADGGAIRRSASGDVGRMDLDAGVWTIPAARMKAKRDHRVPLSGRALVILHDVQRLNDGTGLVFRSLGGKPLSNMTLSKLIKELGIAAVPHGFRSSFRDWAAEQTNTPREVVEAALAHTVRNPTEAAYARSDLFERRRLLMNDWAAYLNG